MNTIGQDFDNHAASVRAGFAMMTPEPQRQRFNHNITMTDTASEPVTESTESSDQIVIRESGLVDAGLRELELLARDGDRRDPGAEIARRHLGETTPAAADLEHALARAQLQLGADHLELVSLGLVEVTRAFLLKFGGDSMDELRSHHDATMRLARALHGGAR
jgi:hypothetical protein